MQIDFLKAAKIIFTSLLMLSLGFALWAQGYFFAKKFIIFNNFSVSQPAPQINAIEISADGYSILNSETKESIFAIKDAKKYLKFSGQEYDPENFQDTMAKYSGDCFLFAVLSNEKDRIVFSTGCLAGDLPQPWIGVYYTTVFYCAPDFNACPKDVSDIEKFNFLLAGGGKNFVWSSDDKTIIYEAKLGLSGMTEIRMIDSETGENLGGKNIPETDDQGAGI